MTMQKWNAEEIEKLKEIYQKGNLSLLAQIFPNRSYSSCVTKAYKLGLKSKELIDAASESSSRYGRTLIL